MISRQTLARRFFGDDLGGEASLWKVYLYRTPPPPRYGPRPVSSLHRLLGRIDGRQSKGRLGQLPSRNRHFSIFFFWSAPSLCFPVVWPVAVS